MILDWLPLLKLITSRTATTKDDEFVAFLEGLLTAPDEKVQGFIDATRK
jgi:hypothetical protein